MRAYVALAALLVTGCRSSHSGGDVTASSAAVPVSPAPSAVPAPPSSGPSRWTGQYSSKPASLYVPDGSEWSGMRWRGDDAGEGVGDGTLSFSVDPGSHHVDGSLDGALGDARIVGTIVDGDLAASVERKTPADRGFTGTIVGKADPAKPGTLSGLMRLSLGDGRLIREATFSMTKGP